MQKNSLVILAKSINHAAYILTKAENYSSIRNEYYRYIHTHTQVAKDKKLSKTVYHYVIEVSRRKNFLDEILETQDLLVTTDVRHIPILHNILRMLAYTLFGQEYTRHKPTTKDLVFISKILGQVNTYLPAETLKKYLKQLIQFNKNTWEQEKNRYYPLPKQLALKYFHPQWYIEYFLHYWDRNEVEQLLQSNNVPKTQWIRVNVPCYTTKNDLIAITKNIEAVMQAQDMVLEQDRTFPDIYKVIHTGKTPVAESGLFKNHTVVIQNKASTIAAHLLGPAPQDVVLDVAAAPGMKSAILARYLDKKGVLISNDISHTRAKTMHKRFVNQKGQVTTVLISDAGGKGQLPLKTCSVDKVLFVAPCSSTGIIGVYPDLRWHTKKDIKTFSELQKNMFTECLRVLKTSGLGVYSVCSIHYLEGESVIKNFLDKITLIDPLWGDPQSCYPTTIEKEEFPTEIPKYCRRLFPHRDQTEGFFYAKFQKK